MASNRHCGALGPCPSAVVASEGAAAWAASNRHGAAAAAMLPPLASPILLPPLVLCPSLDSLPCWLLLWMLPLRLPCSDGSQSNMRLLLVGSAVRAGDRSMEWLLLSAAAQPARRMEGHRRVGWSARSVQGNRCVKWLLLSAAAQPASGVEGCRRMGWSARSVLGKMCVEWSASSVEGHRCVCVCLCVKSAMSMERQRCREWLATSMEACRCVEGHESGV